MESRPILVLGGLFECEEPGVRRAQGGPECLADAETGSLAMVGPWQYQCTGNKPQSGWLGSTPVYPSWVPT